METGGGEGATRGDGDTSDGDEWSPDEALGTETFRQGDVAEGGVDDPDGVEPSARPRRHEGAEGWNLSAPLVAGDAAHQDEDELA
jgi:hypothetical protein